MFGFTIVRQRDLDNLKHLQHEMDRENDKQREDIERLQEELAEARKMPSPDSPEFVEIMREMGRQFAEQVGIDPDLLAYGVAVGPSGPVAVRLDEDERDRESNEADHAEDAARELGYSGPS